MINVEPRNPWGRESLCLAAYAALTAVATFPLILHLRSAIPGSGDAYQFYWNLWWVKRALVSQTNPYVINDVYFPYGADLYFHTLNLLPDVIALPIAALVGLPAAYNVLTFFAFTLSAYGTYRLSSYLLSQEVDPEGVKAEPHRARLAAFIAGTAFTFSSYRYVHLLGHLDLLSTQWLPLSALFLLKTRREPGWRNPIYCGLCLAATMLTSSYYAAFVLVLVALVMAYVFARREDGWPRALSRIVISLGVFVVLVSPVLIAMLSLGRTEGRTTNPAYDIDRFSGDLLAFLVPSPLHPLWGRLVSPLYSTLGRDNGGLEGVMFLGYVPLFLAVTAVRSCRRHIWLLWLVGCVLFGALALGPVLHVAGIAIAPAAVFMPYRLFAHLPYGDIPRVPARFVVMALLCLSPLVAAGAWTVLRRSRPSRVRGLTIALTALILCENAVVPLPLGDLFVPPFFTQLAATPSRGGVLEVPIPDDPSVFPRRMLWQTVHQQPVFGGYLSRSLPPLAFEAIPGFAQFKTGSASIDDVVRYDERGLAAVSRAVLAAYGAGHIVIEKALMPQGDGDRMRVIADGLVGPSARVFEDALTVAYAVPTIRESVPPAPWLDTGWSYLERLPNLDASGRPLRWRWMGERARMAIVTSERARVQLRITAQALGQRRRVRLSIGETEIGILTITPDRATFATPGFLVEAGATFVALESLDGAQSAGADPRRLSVALFDAELVTLDATSAP